MEFIGNGGRAEQFFARYPGLQGKLVPFFFFFRLLIRISLRHRSYGLLWLT